MNSSSPGTSPSAALPLAAAEEVARCLRAWRDRLSPHDVGLPAGNRRRAVGLRRTEVALLAGISSDYLARLEQGRTGMPSLTVLTSLARALRLSGVERDHLYKAAGRIPPPAGQIDRHLSPGVWRILDCLASQPVIVVDAAWDIIAANRIATTLLGDLLQGTGRHPRNLAWRHFHDWPAGYSNSQQVGFRRRVVTGLQQAAQRFPNDAPLAELVRNLQAESPEFVQLWADFAAAGPGVFRCAVVSADAGTLALDCTVLSVADSNVQLLVFTAPLCSPSDRTTDLEGRTSGQ